jgi:hypothetical protein
VMLEDVFTSARVAALLAVVEPQGVQKAT